MTSRRREGTFASVRPVTCALCLNGEIYVENGLHRRLEESEKKRQAMMQAMKDQASKKGPNFTITRKDLTVSIDRRRG